MPSWPVRGDPAAGKMWVEVILPPFVLLTTRPVAPPPPPEGSPRLVWFKTFWNEATNWSIPSFSRCTAVHLEKLGMLQFVASFQNVLNHTNLGEPSGGGGGATGLVVNNTNGGKITSTHIFPVSYTHLRAHETVLDLV